MAVVRFHKGAMLLHDCYDMFNISFFAALCQRNCPTLPVVFTYAARIDAGMCGSAKLPLGDNIEALSREVDSQLSWRDDNCTPCPEPAGTRTSRDTLGEGIHQDRNPSCSDPLCRQGKSSAAQDLSKATQQQDGSLGRGASRGDHAKLPWEQTMSNIKPTDHRMYRQGPAKQVDPLGEVSPNVLNWPGDTAIGVQCGRLKNDKREMPVGSNFGSGKRTLYIDNMAYDISVVNDSDAIRLSSIGSTGSADFFGKPPGGLATAEIGLQKRERGCMLLIW